MCISYFHLFLFRFFFFLWKQENNKRRQIIEEIADNNQTRKRSRRCSSSFIIKTSSAAASCRCCKLLLGMLLPGSNTFAFPFAGQANNKQLQIIQLGAQQMKAIENGSSEAYSPWLFSNFFRIFFCCCCDFSTAVVQTSASNKNRGTTHTNK